MTPRVVGALVFNERDEWVMRGCGYAAATGRTRAQITKRTD
jgi:hypothetical protein